MYIFQINEWRDTDVVKCEEKKKIERERNMFNYFYAVQIFYMPGVLVNEI